MPHHQTIATKSPFHLEGEGVWGWGLNTGLNWYDYGARMYDPQLGRFTTIDPWAEQYNNQSTYLYAHNNPIRYTDYLGLGAEDEVDKDKKKEEEKNKKKEEAKKEEGKKKEENKAKDGDKDKNGNVYHRYGGWVTQEQYDNWESLTATTTANQGPEFSGSIGDWLNKINNLGQRRWTDPETGISYYIDDQGNITNVYPITGVAPAPGFAKGAKVLQTGGNVLKPNTLKALGLTKQQGKFAIEKMKKANGLRNDFHGKIMSNGDVLDDMGRFIDNMLDYLR